MSLASHKGTGMEGTHLSQSRKEHKGIELYFFVTLSSVTLFLRVQSLFSGRGSLPCGICMLVLELKDRWMNKEQHNIPEIAGFVVAREGSKSIPRTCR